MAPDAAVGQRVRPVEAARGNPPLGPAPRGVCQATVSAAVLTQVMLPIAALGET
jgi:hypothetical protein